eukprot:gene4378-4630_t
MTLLHNEVLRASKSYHLHRQQMQIVLQELVQLDAAAARSQVLKRLQQQLTPIQEFSHRLYQLVLSTGSLVPCNEDTTLVPGDISLAPSRGSNSNSSTPKYYFATNLRDNSAQMPHFLLNLLLTLLKLPHDRVFVSVYESNSDQGAHGWLDIMQLSLNVIGTPSRLSARGMLVRETGEARITYLAKVRNMALLPLYQHYVVAKASAASGQGERHPYQGVLPWTPDYVVFINDVFFCPSMVLRLMNYRADITCGTDWMTGGIVSFPPGKPPPQRTQADIKKRPLFYDVWVSRDVTGTKFYAIPPYVNDVSSQAAFNKGLPFRASCCWNGLVVLNAEPFSKGVRFRGHLEGECKASECSLMCEDFARLGYQYVVVDPSVQMTYELHLARDLATSGAEGAGRITWADVKAAGTVAQAAVPPSYNQVECCNLEPNKANVDFTHGCSPRDVFQNNFTATAMAMPSPFY